MARTPHSLGLMFCACIILGAVQSFDKIYEFRKTCDGNIKIMLTNREYLVLYSGETLNVSKCSIAFVAKENGVPLCVKPVYFSITNCNITVQYYKIKGRVDMSFSCKDYPSEFCVHDKEILYISIKNANVKADAMANIKLEVSTEKKSLTFLIGVAVGVGCLAIFCFYVIRPRVLLWRSRRAAAAAQSNNGTQNASTQNRPAPKTNAKKPAQQKLPTAPKQTASKSSTSQKQVSKKPPPKPAPQNGQTTSKQSPKNGTKKKTGDSISQKSVSKQPSSPATPKQPAANNAKTEQYSVKKDATQQPPSQPQSEQLVLAAPEEPQLLLCPLTLPETTNPQLFMPAVEQNGQSQVVGIINPQYIPVAPVPAYHTLYDCPPPPYTPAYTEK